MIAAWLSNSEVATFQFLNARFSLTQPDRASPAVDPVRTYV